MLQSQASFSALISQTMSGIVVQSGTFNSTVDIQAPDGNIGAGGAPSGVYVVVPGLTGILALVAAPSTTTIQSTETKKLGEITSTSKRYAVMDGYFPQIVTGAAQGWRAVVTLTATGEIATYDILGAEPDSHNVQTRLSLQIVGV